MSTLSHHDFEERLWEHVRQLSVGIGPRGSTREGERRAAEYCASVMRESGLRNVRLEPFRSGRSTYLPFGLAIGAGLIGNLSLTARPSRRNALFSVLLNGAGAAGFWSETNFDANWMRRLLPSGDSQNAIGIIPAREEMRRRVVLVGHIDSHRTPLAYSSSRWLRCFSTLVGLAFAALPLCGVAAGLSTLSGTFKLRWLHAVCALFETTVLALIMQAESTSFSHGAHDNASGAATILALGERLAVEPLRHTEVWIVNNGCEEVGCYGLDALLQAHGETLRDAWFLSFDMCGLGSPGLLTREGLLRSYYPDVELLNFAREVAARHPELEVREHRGGAYTDMGLAARRGFKGLTIDFVLPSGHAAHEFMGYWHQTRDTIENLEPEALSKTFRFGWALLQAVDEASEYSGRENLKLEGLDSGESIRLNSE